MFHSLRWRLQVWHALVLAGVLLTFGSTVYHLQWESRLQQIDAELDRTAEILSFRARYLYPSPWRSRRSPASPIPTGPQRPASQGPGGSRIGPANSAPGDRPAPIFLPDELAPTFDPSSEFGWHYIAWSPDGTLLQKSANAPDRDFPNLTQESSGLPPRLAQTINEFREVIHVTTLGSHILVGRSLSPDLNNQHRSGIILAGLGTTTLLTGILLGNWISRRSLRTIAILSNTAAAIAETNLSQRIPTTGIDLEIQQLAETLNQAFDRLQAAFQRQSRFIADASHELRTPITVIIAQCELALLRSRAESEYRSALDASLRAAQRMHALAESLLTLAEAELSLIHI